MGRKRVPKGKIIQKKEQKVLQVIADMGDDVTEDGFVQRFKEMFPKDWQNIIRRYEAHERLTKPGKGHPMAEPNKYLRNMFKVHMNKTKRDS